MLWYHQSLSFAACWCETLVGNLPIMLSHRYRIDGPNKFSFRTLHFGDGWEVHSTFGKQRWKHIAAIDNWLIGSSQMQICLLGHGIWQFVAFTSGAGMCRP